MSGNGKYEQPSPASIRSQAKASSISDSFLISMLTFKYSQILSDSIFKPLKYKVCFPVTVIVPGSDIIISHLNYYKSHLASFHTTNIFFLLRFSTLEPKLILCMPSLCFPPRSEPFKSYPKHYQVKLH